MRKRNKTVHQRVTSAIGVTALFLTGFVIPPALANLNLCGQLLTAAAVETDPEAIKATLFQLLVYDYPLLYQQRTNYFILNNLDKEFNPVPEPRHWSKEYAYALGNSGPRSLVLILLAGLRAAEGKYRPQLDRMLPLVWENLKNDFEDADRLAAFERVPTVPREHFDDVTAILQTIDGQPKLKTAMLALIEENLFEIGEWFNANAASAPKKGPHPREVFLQNLQKNRAKYAIPTSIVSVRGKAADLLIPPDLTKLNHFFEAPVDPARLATHDGILYFDQALWKNVETLNVGAGIIKDRFVGHSAWERYYDAAANWILLDAKANSLTEKTAFITTGHYMQEMLDAHLRALEQLQYSVILAKKSTNAHTRALAEAASISTENGADAMESFLTNARRTALGRVQGTVEGLDALYATVEIWKKKVEEAASALRELRTRAAAAPLSSDQSTVVREGLEKVRTTLELNPLLAKRVQSAKRWF